MAKFTVRVELHGEDQKYTELHEAMKKKGFTKTIVNSDTKIKYKLPTAEYNKIGDFTKQQILDAAKIAASEISDDYSILVTKSNGRLWHNLKEA